MPKMDAPLLAFNRGEVSKVALARIDLEKMRLSAECQINLEPYVVGPAMLRRGLEYIGEVLSDAEAIAIDFVYGKSDTALLELTDSVLRVWISDALLTRPAVSTTISDPNFFGGGSWSTADTTDGATATIASGVLSLTCTPLGGLARAKQSISVASGDQNTEHGLRVVVENGPVTLRIGTTDGLDDVLSQTVIDTGTHSLSFTPGAATVHLQIDSADQWVKYLYTCEIESAGVVEVPTPWVAADLSSLRWTQQADILYLSCYGKQQYKIERRGTRPNARGWSVVKYRSGTGPFHEGADASLTMAPSNYFGNGSITSSRPFFKSGHVGALLRILSPEQFNYTVLGADNAFSLAARVNGVADDRIIGVHVEGTWSGTISFQRSLEGPDSGFVTIASSDVGWGSVPDYTGNFAIAYSDDLESVSGGGTTVGTRYDNVIAWYRLGFEAGKYTSGSATVYMIYQGGSRYGIARIVNYISPTEVGVEILEPFPSTVPSANWQISDWCPEFGWPSAVQFQEDRLWWFSGGQIPIAGSQSSNFVGYAENDEYGNAIGDSGAILEGFGAGPSDRINWALPLTRLLAGREMSIAAIRSSSFDEPLTPTNFSVKDCATQGAARLPAIKVDKRGIFVQQSGRRVYEVEFDAQALDYSPHDLTRLNLDIGKPGFTTTAIARQPDTAVYFPRNDGHCAVLLYDPDEQVVCWWRIQTLGAIEHVRVLPASSGVEDEIYFVVRRVISGVTRRFIEKFTTRDNCAGGLLNELFDSFVSYSGAATGTITLSHLPFTYVGIWADGAYLGQVRTDGSGVATLPAAATAKNIVAGLTGAVETQQNDTPFTEITGLDAYDGLPCEVFADQQPSDKMRHVGTLTVSGGTVTLPNGWAATTAVAFFGFTAPFMSAKLAYARPGMSPLTRKKEIGGIGLVLYDAGAQSLQFGQRFDELDPLPLVEAGDDVPSSTVWSEYDEPVIGLPMQWDTDARLCLLAQAPQPIKLGAAVVEVSD